MTDLAPVERTRLMNAVFATEATLRDLLHPRKVNLASLGNAVPHLHWHVVPRHGDDRHFPKAIWAEPRGHAEFRARRQTGGRWPLRSRNGSRSHAGSRSPDHQPGRRARVHRRLRLRQVAADRAAHQHRPAHVRLLEQLEELNTYKLAPGERLKILELLREPVTFVQQEQAKKFSSRPRAARPA